MSHQESKEQRRLAKLPILLKAKHKIKKNWKKFTGEPENEKKKDTFDLRGWPKNYFESI